jgi:mRNA interferase RelE/StbE
MNVDFRKSFEKDLTDILDENLLQKVKAVIEEVDNAVSLAEIRNIKKLKTDGDYYRIRMGDYRIGLTISDDGVVVFVRVLHRKEIYRYFP